MPSYIDLDLKADASELYADALEAIRAVAPDGWEPSPVESWLLMAGARMGAEIIVAAGKVPTEIYRYPGEKIWRIPFNDAISATGTLQVTATDTAGHTLDAGAQLNVDDVAFVTVAPLTIAAASSTGTVAITAVEQGAAGSGLAGTTVELVSPAGDEVAWISSLALTGPTIGGVDGETPDEYVARLPDELAELSPKVVLWPDAEARARRHALVTRALAINRYDPGPPIDTDAEGHISVFVHDADGAVIGAPARAEIEADIMAQRINGLVAHVLDPTYTRVDVRFTAVADPGQDLAAVEAAAEQAVADFIAPARWGRIGNVATNWTDTAVLARNDLLWVVRDTPGVRRVDTLTLARYSQTQGTADITLDGPAALPAANSVVDGTVTA